MSRFNEGVKIRSLFASMSPRSDGLSARVVIKVTVSQIFIGEKLFTTISSNLFQHRTFGGKH